LLAALLSAMPRTTDYSNHRLVRTPRTFSSVFNSSTPQRPTARSAAAAYGGRPLGPSSYNPTKQKWLVEPEREASVFASKTPLRKYEVPLTSQLDFLAHAGQLAVQYESAPGSKGLHWPAPPEPREVVRDPGLDEFCDAVTGSVGSEIVRSSRKYASSFQSNSRRGGEQVGFSPATSAELGPGVYDLPFEAVKVREPKRASYTFKSQTNSSIFGASSNEPPDNVQSIQSAILNRHWTSKGSAFSTRERFPRVRSRWKD